MYVTINKSFAVSARDTIPEGILLTMLPNAGLTITRKVTVKARIDAGSYPIFFGNLDSVEITGQPVNSQWFGKTAVKMKSAINSLYTGTVVIPAGLYNLSAADTLKLKSGVIVIVDHHRSILDFSGN